MSAAATAAALAVLPACSVTRQAEKRTERSSLADPLASEASLKGPVCC